jgi:hypothetical protein
VNESCADANACSWPLVTCGWMMNPEEPRRSCLHSARSGPTSFSLRASSGRLAQLPLAQHSLPVRKGWSTTCGCWQDAQSMGRSYKGATPACVAASAPRVRLQPLRNQAFSRGRLRGGYRAPSPCAPTYSTLPLQRGSRMNQNPPGGRAGNEARGSLVRNGCRCPSHSHKYAWIACIRAKSVSSTPS